MINPNTTVCPSATAEPGAMVLGVVGSDQTVQFLAEPLPVTSEFIEQAKQHESPEKQYRFANRCVRSGCSQWAQGRCGVIDTIMQFNAHLPDSIPLSACSIRSQCRWFNQVGRQACLVCPFIITDSQETPEQRLIYIDSHEL